MKDLEPDGAGAVEVGGLAGGLGHVRGQCPRVVDGRGGGEGDGAAGLDGGGGGGRRAGTVLMFVVSQPHDRATKQTDKQTGGPGRLGQKRMIRIIDHSIYPSSALTITASFP